MCGSCCSCPLWRYGRRRAGRKFAIQPHCLEPISDAQGAIIPGAQITVTSVATGQARSAESDAAGGFLFSLLPVGSYDLTVEQPGFRKSERTGILLQANENIRADVQLEVGNVTETVTVEASALTVDTRSATLNTTVDSRRVVELPLNGRNPADLVLLAPGRCVRRGQQQRRRGRRGLASPRPEGSHHQRLAQ